MTYEDALERIFKQCKGMTIRDVDFVLLVAMMANTDAAIMYQAARNLDAQSVAAAGKRIAAALRAAGVACSDWSEGVVLVDGWRHDRDLRVSAGLEHDPDGDHILVDIESADLDGDIDYLVESLPIEDLDYIVEQVKRILAA